MHAKTHVDAIMSEECYLEQKLTNQTTQLFHTLTILYIGTASGINSGAPTVQLSTSKSSWF